MTDYRTWRVGTHYGIHVYAENPPGFGDDEPLFTAQNPDVARQIVKDHNMIYQGQYVVTTKEQAHNQAELRKDLSRLYAEQIELVKANVDLKRRHDRQAEELREAERKLTLIRRGLHGVMCVDDAADGCAAPVEAACE